MTDLNQGGVKWPFVALAGVKALLPTLAGALLGALASGVFPESPPVVALRAAVRPILCASSLSSPPQTEPLVRP